MSPKKIWKIIGATFGVAAICCIIPACVVSCGSSSSSPSSTPTTNSSTGDNLIGATVSSNYASVTSSNFNQFMESIDGQGLSSQDSNEMNSIYSFWQSSTANQTSYTFSLNQNITGAYGWFSINTNGSNTPSYSSPGENGYTQAIANLVQQDGTYLGDGQTYTWNGAVSSGGNMFVCRISNSTGTYYSKVIWLWTDATPTSTSPSGSTSSSSQANNPLAISDYALSTSSDATSVTANGYTDIEASNGGKVSFTLSLYSSSGGNLTASSFSSGEYYVEYVFNNPNNYSQTVNSKQLDLSQSSSWSYTFDVTPGLWNVSVNIYNSNGNVVYTANGNTISNNGASYQIVCQYATIAWNPSAVQYGDSSTIELTAGTSYWTNANYYWQVSSDNGKSWTNIPNQTGELTSLTSLANEASYTVNKEESNNNSYRLEIVNANFPSELFYSNVLSANDDLVTPTISFTNSTYQNEFTSSKTWGALVSTTPATVNLTISLSQFGSATTNAKLLSELSGSVYINNQDYSNFSSNPYQLSTFNSLSSYYDAKTNSIVLPISTSDLVSFEQDVISEYNNYNGTTSTAWQPISIQLTINQGNNSINTNTLTLTPEQASINLSSAKGFNLVKNTYYCSYGQEVTLDSSNSSLSFPSTTTYTWQSSTDGTTWTNVDNATGPSLQVTLDSNIYYRMVAGETQMGAVQIVSNVIHFDPSVPTGKIQFVATPTNSTNSPSVDVVTNDNAIVLNGNFTQNGNSLVSSNDVQVTYQYQVNGGTWTNYNNGNPLTSQSLLWSYTPSQTGTINIRLKYVYNSIVSYSNTLTIYQIDPTIVPVSGLNSNDNANDYIKQNGNTYTYNYGSNACLTLSNPALTRQSLYSIYSITWYEEGVSTPLATYYSNENIGNTYFDYPYCPFSVTNGGEYYAKITWTNNDVGTTQQTTTTNPITIDSSNNSNYVINITLNNASAINSDFYMQDSGYQGANEYYFLNSYNLWMYADNQGNGANIQTYPSLSLNIYQNGQALSATYKDFNTNSNEYKVNWYVSFYNGKQWSSLASYNTIYSSIYKAMNKNAGGENNKYSLPVENGLLNSTSSWTLKEFFPLTSQWINNYNYDYENGYGGVEVVPSTIDGINTSSITNMRICAQVTTPYASYYSNYYYMNIPGPTYTVD